MQNAIFAEVRHRRGRVDGVRAGRVRLAFDPRLLLAERLGRMAAVIRARPIPEVIADTKDEALKARLERIAEIREFASRELRPARE